MRDHIDRGEAMWRWWPETLVYVDHFSRPFEVFSRSQSTRYFEGAKVLLGVDSKEELQDTVGAFGPGDLPRWQFESFSPAHLLGLEQLATRP